MAPAQTVAEAEKDTKLLETKTAQPTGQGAEQDISKAAAADQTVVKADKGAELSTKQAAQTTEH